MKVPLAFAGRTAIDHAGRTIFPIRLFGGLGDHLFSFPAMIEYGRRLNYPCFDVLAARCFDLIGQLECVSTLHRVPSLDLWDPNGGSTKYDGVVCLNLSPDLDCGDHTPVSHGFHLLDIPDTPFDQRRFWLPLSKEDHNFAQSFFERIGWRGERLVGVQISGNMVAKHYSHTWDLLCRIRQNGWFAYWNSGTPDGAGKISYFGMGGLDDVRTERISNILDLARIQSISYAYMGYESGSSYLALAVDCPAVILSGAVDVNGLLGTLQGHRWCRQLRLNWVYRCAQQFGMTCRHGYGVPWHGGSEYCPIRGRWFGVHTPDKAGCDCIDLISIDEICSALSSVGNQKLRDNGEFGA